MVVYFLVVEKEISDNLTKNQLILSSITHHDNDDNIHTINFNQLDTTDPIDHSEHYTNTDERSTVSISGILATVVRNEEMSDVEFEPSDEVVESSTSSVVKPTKSDVYVPGHRNTQILEISTPKLNKEFERPETTDADEDYTETKILLPTKETLEFFGFTSGHQNNFGVPIEEDERVLRMLNEQLIRREKNRNGSDSYTTTTDAYAYRTRVSPTLPVINSMDPTTERLNANSTDDGGFPISFLKNCGCSDKNLNFLQVFASRHLSQCVAVFCTMIWPQLRTTGVSHQSIGSISSIWLSRNVHPELMNLFVRSWSRNVVQREWEFCLLAGGFVKVSEWAGRWKSKVLSR